MEAQKEKVISAMRLLFIITVVAIPLSVVALFIAGWLIYIPAVVVLIGAVMLWRAIGGTYLKVSVISGAIYVVLYLAGRLIPADSAGTLAVVLSVMNVLSAVCGLVHQFTLLRGAADYMEAQGCPDTAKEGRTAAVLALIVSVGTVVLSLISAAALAVSSGSAFALLIAAVTGVVGLVLAVMGIIALFSRLSFFYKSAKRLKDGIIEIPLQDRKEQKNEETSQ